MIILYCHGLCSDYFLKNYFTKALLVIRRLLQTVPKKIWWLFKEHIKWCCNCAAHLDWGIQTLMESELSSWRMPSQSHCLLWSPKEMCSHSSQVTFYKSLTYFWVLCHTKGENVLAGQCLGIHISQTQEVTESGLCISWIGKTSHLLVWWVVPIFS